MATENAYQLKTAAGAEINPKTLAALVSTADGKNVEVRLAEIYSIASGATVTKIVADIAARDALAGMQTGWQVWVLDASADSTVMSGGAKYLYNAEDQENPWVKTAEVESMDLVLQWAAVQGVPDVLKQLSVMNGKLTLNGAPVDDGMVDVAVVNAGEEAPANLRASGILLERI